MVSNYLNQCRYFFDKLKKHIYLITGSENIIIDKNDDSQYYASAVSLSNVTVLNGFDISFTDEDSLDARWKFKKTLNISVNGKIDVQSYSGEIYAVIETYDGTKYLVNPDFPLDLTYQYSLAEGLNQTNITLQTPSNMPTLEFKGNGLENVLECRKYALNGIDKLFLIEKDYAIYDSRNEELKLTNELKQIEFLDGSCSLSESYNGEVVTNTIEFSISLDDYKTSWQYRLLEFKENLYRAIIYSKDGYIYYVGFNYGLQPSYLINSSSSNESDTIKITLTEASLLGCFKKQDDSTDIDTATTWVFINTLGGHKSYICDVSVGCGWAESFILAEVDALGNQTGRYKVEESIYYGVFVQDDPDIDYSYYEQFYWLRQYNVIGSFESDYPNGYFPTNECACHQTDECRISGNMPSHISFIGSGSTSFTFAASCDWVINDVPSGFTISPYSGVADSSYTITISTTTNQITEGQFKLSCCSSLYVYNLSISEAEDCLENPIRTVNCLEHTEQFRIKEGCSLTINSGYTSGITYSIDNGYLNVYIPKNESTFGRTFYMSGSCCGDNVNIQIDQMGYYEMWVEDGYICSSGNQYVREVKYTGVTSAEWVKTDEYRIGDLVEADSPECRSLEKYVMVGYICVDGDKYELFQRYASYDDGASWEAQPQVRLGAFIEADSSFCSSATSYEYRLTREWVCL